MKQHMDRASTMNFMKPKTQVEILLSPLHVTLPPFSNEERSSNMNRARESGNVRRVIHEKPILKRFNHQNQRQTMTFTRYGVAAMSMAKCPSCYWEWKAFNGNSRNRTLFLNLHQQSIASWLLSCRDWSCNGLCSLGELRLCR